MKKIAVIPGDGIGVEVTEESVSILNAAQSHLYNKDIFQFKYFDWGSEYYLNNNKMMPINALEKL